MNRSTANRPCENTDRGGTELADHGSAPGTASGCAEPMEQLGFEADFRLTDEHRGFIHFVREYLEDRLSSAEAQVRLKDLAEAWGKSA